MKGAYESASGTLTPGNPPKKERQPIVCLRFRGKMPPPSKAVPMPTPDEMHLLKQAQRAQAASHCSDEIHDGVNDVKGSGVPIKSRFKGAALAVMAFSRRVAVEVQTATSRTIRDSHTHRALKHFMEEFPHLAENGSVFTSLHHCSVVHQGRFCALTAFVCSTHLCFSSGELLDMIPLSQIGSVKLSVTLATTDGVPYVIILPSGRVMPTAVQIFTTDGKCHQLCLFKGTALESAASSTIDLSYVEMFYNALDHAWRAEVKVPVEGVEYDDDSAREEEDEERH